MFYLYSQKAVFLKTLVRKAMHKLYPENCKLSLIVTISTDTEQAFYKIQNSFLINNIKNKIFKINLTGMQDLYQIHGLKDLVLGSFLQLYLYI